MLYYKGKQKGDKMLTILMMLFACGEEKTNDSAVVEEQDSSSVETQEK
tara:strand:+ start:1632 stop:1775 length:144 start_codon:yes stop_codon:yes gene_type:complete